MSLIPVYLSVSALFLNSLLLYLVKNYTRKLGNFKTFINISAFINVYICFLLAILNPVSFYWYPPPIQVSSHISAIFHVQLHLRLLRSVIYRESSEGTCDFSYQSIITVLHGSFLRFIFSAVFLRCNSHTLSVLDCHKVRNWQVSNTFFICCSIKPQDYSRSYSRCFVCIQLLFQTWTPGMVQASLVHFTSRSLCRYWCELLVSNDLLRSKIISHSVISVTFSSLHRIELARLISLMTFLRVTTTSP